MTASHALSQLSYGPTNFQTNSLMISRVARAEIAVKQTSPLLLMHSADKILLTLEDRFALLEKRLDALILVSCRKAQREQIDFATQTFIQVGTRSNLDGLLGQAHGNRSLLSDAIGNLHRF